MSACFKDTNVIPILLGISSVYYFCPLTKLHCTIEALLSEKKKEKRKKCHAHDLVRGCLTCQQKSPLSIAHRPGLSSDEPSWNSVAPRVKKAWSAAGLNNNTNFVGRTPGAVSK